MLLVIAPSKTQKFDGLVPKEHTLPVFLPEITTLVGQLKDLDRNGLAGLMNLSEKLVDSTWSRFQEFSSSFASENARQAILAFQDDVYAGMRVEEFSPEDFTFAQGHLRILSGLYGVLKPLDLMQPYRLEMQTKLKTASADNLYDFWGNTITESLNHDLVEGGNTHVVNLASQEYFKAVKPALLKRPVLNIAFKAKKNGQYRIIAIYAKRARGLMAKFVIKNRLVDINDLKKFKEDGYRYHDSLSSELQWVFCKG